MLIPHISSNSLSGCVLPFEEVTSRTFESLQSSCSLSCDMHKLLQEANERFRTHHLNLPFRTKNQDNTVELTNPNSDKVSPAKQQRSSEYWNGKRLQHLNLQSKNAYLKGVVPVFNVISQSTAHLHSLSSKAKQIMDLTVNQINYECLYSHAHYNLMKLTLNNLLLQHGLIPFVRNMRYIGIRNMFFNICICNYFNCQSYCNLHA